MSASAPSPTTSETATAIPEIVLDPNALYKVRMSRGMPHCKRGPRKCKRCQSMSSGYRYTLIKLLVNQSFQEQRQVVSAMDPKTNEEVICCFDTVHTFQNEQEAVAFAQKHKIQSDV